MTLETIIKDFKNIAEALDCTPTKNEFLNYSETKYHYLKYFKRYNQLVKAAGYTPNRIRISAEKNEKVSSVLTIPTKKAVKYVRVIKHKKTADRNELEKDIVETLTKYPDCRHNICEYLKKAKYSCHCYYKVLGKNGKIREMINVIWKRIETKKNYECRHYPIILKGRPIQLRWSMRRHG